MPKFRQAATGHRRICEIFMFKLFEQIFHRDAGPATTYPDELIHRAIERAVDATDPRMRMLSSYKKALRPAVIHAVDCVVTLVNGLFGPVPLSSEGWRSRAIVGALFASADSLRAVVACDRACRDFAMMHRLVKEPVTALLLAKCSEKHTFGYDVVDDRTVADVPLTVVSFDEHRLIGLAAHESETRRLLQLRAFDYLLAQALQEITAVKDVRQDLNTRKKLLRAKLDIVARSNGRMADEPNLAGRHELQQKLDAIESALHEAGADADVLQGNLDIAIATLTDAGQRLRLEAQTLYLDNMHYLRPAGHPGAVELSLQMLRDNHDGAMVAQLVAIPPESFAKG